MPPDLNKLPCYSECRTKNIHLSEKALRTRRKVFCWEPPRSLTIPTAAGAIGGRATLPAVLPAAGFQPALTA
jgi:hypothetical protein